MDYRIEKQGGKFIVYSFVDTNYNGIAKNYVAECDSEGAAKALIDRLLRP
jgi:hypothetical protein